MPFHDVYIHAPRPRREGRQDVEVEGQRHRSARADRRVRRRRAALHAGARWRRRAATSSSSPQRVEGYRNFATKLWNAARFAEMNGCARVAGFDPATAKETLNRWIAHETARAAREVTEAIEAYRSTRRPTRPIASSGTSSATGISNWPSRCSPGADEAAKAETRAMAAWVLDEILQAAASVHAVHHRGAVGVTAETGPQRDGAADARRRGRSSTASTTPRPRPRSAG